MATTLETFRVLIPEFAGVDDTTVNTVLSLASDEMNVARWSEASLFQQGAIYLAAHKLSIRKASEDSANLALSPALVNSLTEDRLSIGFRDQAGGGAPGYSSLESTPYGQEYLRLRRKAILTPQLAE